VRGGEAWHGMAFRFSLFTFKDFLGSDSILGKYPVANSLFLENKIPKKRNNFFLAKNHDNLPVQQETVLKGRRKRKRKKVHRFFR